MTERRLVLGPWTVACTPEDGGRLTSLRHGGTDLLTGAPTAFRPPAADHGRYEMRPVHGYDDCFPSVDACAWPEGGWQVPDHGELCWLPAEVTQPAPDRLEFAFASRALPVRFVRAMRFGASELEWAFRVENCGDRPLAFLHVMHALLPVVRVTIHRLPRFASCVDEVSGLAAACRQPEEVAGLLRGVRGAARMLLLRGVEEGRVVLALDGADGRPASRRRLTVLFPAALFPTLGIWWNAGGYPDEDGRRREECAFEPLSGPRSSLAACRSAGGTVLSAPAGGAVEWTILWRVESEETAERNDGTEERKWPGCS